MEEKGKKNEPIKSLDSYYLLLGELASGIFHEIRTPLQFIDNNLLFLEDSVTEENPESLTEEVIQAIKESREGLEQINSLMSALRNMSYLRKDHFLWEDPSVIWKNASLISKGEWKKNSIIKDLSKGTSLIHCNPSLLMQVFINLIINASHAFADSQEEENFITFDCYTSKDSITLKISDNGSGMDKETKAHIFDPFFTTKDSGKGSGQGLCFVKKIIEEVHGGIIVCESSLGEGTQFYITLKSWKEKSL